MLKFFNRNAYRKDILLVILLKLILLSLLWYCFFSHPVAETLNTEMLTAHYLTTPKH